MRITHLKSSTELIEMNGIKILTDPWLSDGEYYGAWYHVPPYEGTIEDIDVDFIYISHIHPDHTSTKTLAKMKKDIPVLIHKYAKPFLKNNIERLGFSVTELKHNASHSIADNVEITIFAADNCNPALCSKFLGCAPVENKMGSTRIDSMCVIRDKEFTILNTNDCPYELAKDALNKLLSRFGKIDFLLVGYSGAGPYPQCFHFDDPKEQLKAAKRKEKQFLRMAMQYIEHVSPRFFMPFAGTYTLGGHLHRLNSIRGVPDIADAFDFLVSECTEKGLETRGVLLNTGAHFDFSTETSSAKYKRLTTSEYETHIQNISKRTLDYERFQYPEKAEILELFPAAYERFNRKRKEINFTTDTRLLIQISDNEVVRLPFGDQWSVQNLSEETQTPGYVLIACDTRLLLQMLKGPRFAHWNNAEIGSHLRFQREPDIFERSIYHCLCFLHT